MKFLILLCYLVFFNLYSEDFEIEIFFSVNSNDIDIIEFPNNTKYQQVKNTANWQNTYGDYGVLKCLFNIYLGENNKNANLLGFCKGKNQDNEKLWLEFERNTEDFDAGIGRSKFIFGTGKYKKFIGTQCVYAVKLLDDSAFSKHKCNLKIDKISLSIN